MSLLFACTLGLASEKGAVVSQLEGKCVPLPLADDPDTTKSWASRFVPTLTRNQKIALGAALVGTAGVMAYKSGIYEELYTDGWGCSTDSMQLGKRFSSFFEGLMQKPPELDSTLGWIGSLSYRINTAIRAWWSRGLSLSWN